MTENPDVKLLMIMEAIKRIFDESGLAAPGMEGYNRDSYRKDLEGQHAHTRAHTALTDGLWEIKPPFKDRISTTETDYGPADQTSATYVILFKWLEGGRADVKHIQVVDPIQFNWDGFLRDLGFLLGGKITRPEGL
jgi:hypothetical protein